MPQSIMVQVCRFAGQLADTLVGVRPGQHDVNLDATLRGRAQPVEEEVVGGEVRGRQPEPFLGHAQHHPEVALRRPSQGWLSPGRPGPRRCPVAAGPGRGPRRYTARDRSRPSSARTPRDSPSTAGPRTRAWVSRHSRSLRASPHHSSAMPTPPMNPSCSSTTSTLRWHRWLCLNGT